MRQVILHTLSIRFPANIAPSGIRPILAAGVLDIENKKFLFFTPQDAFAIPEIIKNADLLITYNGTGSDLPILRKYCGLKGKTTAIPRVGKHIEILREISKIGRRYAISFDETVRENLHEGRLFPQSKIHRLTIDELHDACKHDINQIANLYQIYLSGELRCPAGKPRPIRQKIKSLEELEKEALLTVELVPKTSWFTNVRSQVSQKNWDNIRRVVYKNAHYKCQICGSVGPLHPVECHEIWEYIDLQEIQKLKGFIALCPQCHEVKHMGLASIRGRKEVAIAHLARVNKWSEAEARRYVGSAVMKWLDRSNTNWSIDLGLLDAMNISYIENQSRLPSETDILE